jgi:hypothetical protein
MTPQDSDHGIATAAVLASAQLQARAVLNLTMTPSLTTAFATQGSASKQVGYVTWVVCQKIYKYVTEEHVHMSVLCAVTRRLIGLVRCTDGMWVVCQKNV